MTRTNLPLLHEMCKKAGKVLPDVWPEGLLGIGFDMRAWVEAQEALPKKVKTTPKKEKSTSDNK